MLSIECNEYFTEASSIRASAAFFHIKQDGGEEIKKNNLKVVLLLDCRWLTGSTSGVALASRLPFYSDYVMAASLPPPSPVLSHSKQCHPSIVITPLPSSPWNDLSLINCILMSRST